jgi:hypothetical protein
LYAIKTASPEDSIIFVRLRKKPMIVRKRKAVTATPKRVEERGDDAAAG